MENKQSPGGRGEPLIPRGPCTPAPADTLRLPRLGKALSQPLHMLGSVPGMPFPRVSGHQCNVLSQPLHTVGSVPRMSFPRAGLWSSITYSSFEIQPKYPILCETFPSCLSTCATALNVDHNVCFCHPWPNSAVPESRGYLAYTFVATLPQPWYMLHKYLLKEGLTYGK